MKIGIFTDSYKPYTSGVVTSITTFIEEMTRFFHDLHIFSPSYPNYDDTEANVYRFYSVPSPTNPDYTLAIPVYPGLNIIVKKLKLDIIHAQSPFTMGRLGMHFARKYKIPLLLTYHSRYDQYVHYVPLAQDLAREVTIKFSSSFCNHCDHIIVPSHDIKDIVSNFEVHKPISIIPTGIPLYKFENGNEKWLREQYDIPQDNKILLFVGRLTKEKNLPFLIKAFQKIKIQEPIHLVLTAQDAGIELKNLSRQLAFPSMILYLPERCLLKPLVHVYFRQTSLFFHHYPRPRVWYLPRLWRPDFR